MKIVLQRVKSAKVRVEGEVVGEIKDGFLIFLGVEQGDCEDDIERLCKKVINLRVIGDKNEKMNLSILDTKGEILVVSQFTLCADLNKGNRPSFVKAAKPDIARDLYRKFVANLIEKGILVKMGKFGAMMEIENVQDGPVTILMDSKNI